MCGIYASLSEYEPSYTQTNSILEKMRQRGPDGNGIKIIKQDLENDEHYWGRFLHTRLRINGDTSPQPFETERYILVVNGEIFNYKALELELDYTCTKSDCEIILPLFEKYGVSLLDKIKGQFSLILYDKLNNKVFIARDHIGITPLYIGLSIFNYPGRKSIAFASEMKTLLDHEYIDIFPPRTYVFDTPENLLKNGVTLNEYKNYSVTSMEIESHPRDLVKSNLFNLLYNSVESQLHGLSKESFGVLLSGGLDSSLIASLVASKCNYKIKTFSVGTSPEAPDLVFARDVARYIGSEHYEYYYTVENGIHEIPDIVKAIETYDVTTIRASTPMYILASKIKRDFPEIKVLFSGEGSDELFGGYLYFSNAPNSKEFGTECIKRVHNLHYSDCQRANKSCMAHSLEVRVPFLDEAFVEYVLSINPEFKVFGKLNKLVCEKQILRDSFPNYLPHHVLYRQKEQFSDGIGYNWIDSLKEYSEELISDHEFKSYQLNFSYNTPQTKEALWYRDVFFNIFGKGSNTVNCWIPTWSHSTDPSGRVQIYHNTPTF
jgi:asparagine synthase (glutamine-hydrolysing)